MMRIQAALLFLALPHAQGSDHSQSPQQCSAISEDVAFERLSDISESCRNEIDYLRRLAQVAKMERSSCPAILRLTPATSDVAGFGRTLLARTLYACGNQQRFLSVLDALVADQPYTHSSQPAARVEELIQYQDLGEWLEDEELYTRSLFNALELVCSSAELFETVSNSLRDDHRAVFEPGPVISTLLWNWHRLETRPASENLRICLSRALDQVVDHAKKTLPPEDFESQLKEAERIWLIDLRTLLEPVEQGRR